MGDHVDKGLQAGRRPQHHRAKQGAAALCHMGEEGVVAALLNPLGADDKHLQAGRKTSSAGLRAASSAAWVPVLALSSVGAPCLP